MQGDEMKIIDAAGQSVIRGLESTLLLAAGCLALACSAAIAAPVAAADPAQQCLADLGVLSASMQKDGYWLEGAGYGYGYPVYGYGYSYGDRHGDSAGYGRARPGYEVRTLLAAARILAQRGQQQPCETVLGATRDAYANYVAELRNGQIPTADLATWRRQQIETAVSVTGGGIVYRSDLLIGESVVNAKNEDLGSVEDIVMSPQTGKIAYLVIGHGGFWGIDEKYSPVPWSDFKSAVGSNLLVLTVTKTALDASPQVRKDEVSGPTGFAAQSRKIDAYWTAHPPVAMN
jgi:sporulation protein YlmC with PRC-barrel domain